MSIEIVRYIGKTVTPLTDALLFEKAIPINGIYNGCVLSHLGSNQVAITSGNGIIKGRDFKVTAETKLVQLASSGTMSGRIYVRINLSDSVNTIQLLSVCASSLPALVQDANFNLTNGIWEMELATYSATTTAISGLTTTYATVKKSLTENNIVNTNTATEEGTVADGRQLNPLNTGSLAKQVVDNATFSTTETIIGTFDGKTHYRKILNTGALPNATTKNVAHGITSLDYFTSLKGMAKNPTLSIENPMPFIDTGSLANGIALQRNTANIQITTGTDRTAYTYSHVVMEYVKTV